ncbi:conserved Plasmodium protein, unknown function [Plasmodium malariae]|uniref:ER membrane protein complex subunit 10 n=1 Tax=Plasmodium malariae TaxID=5858 RepID=A0A1C3KAM1_PLAMA|nr:conserved Plasmodium protein, unknown function [Plasmodium malariae]
MGGRKTIFLLFYQLFITSVLCSKNLIQLNYQINSYSLDNKNYKEWNNIGTFILNKNQIFNTSNTHVEEKRKLIEKLKEGKFDYVLFQLCYDTKQQTCIQTYADKSKVHNVDNFALLVGLNNNYIPYVLNYRTYKQHNDENIHIFSELFMVKVSSVSVSIDLHNLKKAEGNVKPKNKENEQEKEKEKPLSFIRKYWIYIAIFFLSLSISKHFTEDMQQPTNR